MTRRCIKATIFVSACFATASATAAPPVEWDGLQRVQAKRFALVYIPPGADFRQYTKVMIEPTEVAFQKNWRRDYNSSVRDLGAKVLDREGTARVVRYR